MPTLYIIEYARQARDNLQNPVGAGEEPGLAQTVPFGEKSNLSKPFASTAQFVRLIADEPCHIAFGDDPTADKGCTLLPADKPEIFGLSRAGLRVAVIAEE